jgi:8-oxo-dGTP pyrophosphatase MutT (NUDIX family)
MKNRHIGIYGVCKRNGSFLFIKKSRGPYTGLLDFPGGGIEFGENLEQALRREFQEEVGAEIKINNIIQNTDCFSVWSDDGVKTKTHHIGLYYVTPHCPQKSLDKATPGNGNGIQMLCIA